MLQQLLDNVAHTHLIVWSPAPEATQSPLGLTARQRTGSLCASEMTALHTLLFILQILAAQERQKHTK